MSDSLLRKAEHAALSKIELHGQVLDLGGDKRSAYRSLIRGNFSVTTLNLDPKSQPDIVHDLEQALPVADASYDGVLLINVLEHVYHDRQLLAEASRVLKPGGVAVVVVPFLFPVHPSPHDFRRFTAHTLHQMMLDAGFSSADVTPLGDGVWSARHLQLNRLLPSPLRQIHGLLGGALSSALDWLTGRLARATGRSYDPGHYALGYVAIAGKLLAAAEPR